MKIKVFDFFCGCGGASCGFRNAGMDIVFGLDCDLDSQRTFQRNFFPLARFELSDIREVSFGDIRYHWAIFVRLSRNIDRTQFCSADVRPVSRSRSRTRRVRHVEQMLVFRFSLISRGSLRVANWISFS